MKEMKLVVELPSPIKAMVEGRIASGDYPSPEDYVRSLIEADLERLKKQEIDLQLLQGIKSGPASTMTQKDWDQIRREGKKRVAQRKSDDR